MSHHAGLSPWHVAAAELCAGVASALALPQIPAWLAGACAAFVVGVTLRLLDPWLRLRGERLALRAPAASVAPLERAVLVVDDNRHLCALVALALRSAGIVAHEAHTAADALALWSRHRPLVVVVDLMLPDELGDALIARFPRSVRAILTSGVAEAHTLDSAAHRCGAVSLRKPAHDVVSVCRGLLDG